MSDERTTDPQGQLERLRKAIAAQEALRGKIPDEALETTLSTLRARLEALQGASASRITVRQQADSVGDGALLIGVLRGNVYRAAPPRDDAEQGPISHF